MNKRPLLGANYYPEAWPESEQEYGIDVILGTPTATPPIWLEEKDPSMMAVDEFGIPQQHGAQTRCRQLGVPFCAGSDAHNLAALPSVSAYHALFSQ